jgi:transcriptional regulator with XRE-family HTH domain
MGLFVVETEWSSPSGELRMSTAESQRYLIGEDLVALRRKIGWSQQAVAEYLELSDASDVSHIENGRRWITCAEEVLLQQLEKAFEAGELESDLNDGFHPDLEGMPAGNFYHQLEDPVASPGVPCLYESSTPHIYITFTNLKHGLVKTQGRSSPPNRTLGPYLDVELSEGAMHVTVPETKASHLYKFRLATLEGAGWKVHDGLEKNAPIYMLVTFHAFRYGGKRRVRAIRKDQSQLRH